MTLLPARQFILRRPTGRDRLGALESVDGVPTRETTKTVYDQLDFTHALNAYLNGFPGASTQAMHKGFAMARQ